MTDAPSLTREDAIERLASDLYWTARRLDLPVFSEGEAPEWGSQTKYVRDSYREAVECFLLNVEALKRAMSDD